MEQLKKSNEHAADRILELERFSIEDIKTVQGDRNVKQDLETLRLTVSSNKETLGLLASTCADLEALLSDLNANFSKVTTLSRVLLFGWYLIFALLISFAALLIR